MALERWPGPDGIKRRLAHDLQERRPRAREPFVQWLTEPQQRICALALSRHPDTRQ